MTATTQTAHDVQAKVIEIISEQLGMDPSEICRESDFYTDLPMDSLDRVEIMMECEDTFAITIPEDQQQAIRTVAQATDCIVAHIG